MILLIESLSNSVFERRTSTGSGLFASLGSGLVQTLGQIVFIREKKLSNTNLLESRRIKEKKASLPVDVRRSKTSLLKLPNNNDDDDDDDDDDNDEFYHLEEKPLFQYLFTLFTKI